MDKQKLQQFADALEVSISNGADYTHPTLLLKLVNILLEHSPQQLTHEE